MRCAEPGYAIARHELTDQDRASIAISILRDQISCRNLRKNDSFVLKINEYIRREWFASFSDIRLILLSEQEIDSRVKSDASFSYGSFEGFEIAGKKVIVNFGEPTSLTSVSGPIYEYRKISGRWRGTITGVFAACGRIVDGPVK